MAQLIMQKVRLFVRHRDASALMRLVQDFGNFEIIDNTKDEVLTPHEHTSFEHRHTSAELDTAVTFLGDYHKGGFVRGVFEGNRAHTNPRELEEIVRTYDPHPVIERITHLQKELNALSVQERTREEHRQRLFEWKRLAYTLSEIVETKNVFTTPLRGPAKALQEFKTALTKETSLVDFIEVSETTYLVVAHHSTKALIEELAHASDVETVELPQTGKTANQELYEVENELKTITLKRAALHTEAKEIAAGHLPTLKKLADNALWHMEYTDVALTRAGTRCTRVVDGWVPVRSLSVLEALLKKELPASALESLEKAEGEEPPVEIANKGFFNSFETITRLYGVPSHTDLDPTPFLALFFFIFFGLSLSDVGYGAVLMALTGVVLLRYKIQPGMKQLLTMLFFGGLGSFIVGFMFGGYLGISPEVIHPALVSLQLFNPITDPLPVFYMSLAFGFVHISFGIVLDIVRSINAKDTLNGVLNNVPWLLMFALLFTMVLAQIHLFPEAVNGFVLASWGMGALGVAVLIMVTQGRNGTNIFSKLATGVLSLYSGVNYLSDLLSYSRLLALGLATGALAFSINLIAGFIAGDSLGIGTFFAVIVLIFGHTLNVTLSVLGAFIHSARLQFVEFFSKFVTGTGRAFNAFRKKERYVIMLPETPT